MSSLRRLCRLEAGSGLARSKLLFVSVAKVMQYVKMWASNGYSHDNCMNGNRYLLRRWLLASNCFTALNDAYIIHTWKCVVLLSWYLNVSLCVSTSNFVHINANWPCYWLRSITSLMPKRWGGFAVSCHSPYCTHQYCASVAIDQIETTFLDFLHPLIWLLVNHVSLSNLSCQLSNMLTFATIILTLFYVTHYFPPLCICMYCMHTLYTCTILMLIRVPTTLPHALQQSLLFFSWNPLLTQQKPASSE